VFLTGFYFVKVLLIAAEPEKKVIRGLTNMEKSTEILNGTQWSEASADDAAGRR